MSLILVPEILNHIIIIGESNTELHNMAGYISKAQKIKYKILLVIKGVNFPTLTEGVNYIFVSKSLDAFPSSVKDVSIILKRPLICI